MLHRLTLSNFFSVREEQSLELKIARNAPDLFPVSWGDGETRLPAVVGIYGANGSGKSTVIRGVTAVIHFVVESFIALRPGDPIPYVRPFLAEATANGLSTIVIRFDAAWRGSENRDVYEYELALQCADGMARHVARERLRYWPQGKGHPRTLFERDGQRIRGSREFEHDSNSAVLNAVRPNASVIGTFAQLNHPMAGRVQRDLRQVQSNIWRGHRQALPDELVWTFYAQMPDALTELNRQIRRLDIGLEEISLEVTARGPEPRFRHAKLIRPLMFEEESGGTQSFVRMFPQILMALRLGNVAVIDEIDAELHPHLVEEILAWFKDRTMNKGCAQLFFTAHNVALMDRLEAEEVYFTEKGRTGATEVYGAREVKGLRRDVSIGRKYLGGALGAVPNIG